MEAGLKRFYALIDGDAGGYGVAFPDLPGCTAMGTTIDAAIGHAADALRDWVKASEARAQEVPLPSDIEALRRDSDVARALAAGATLTTIPLIRDTGRSVKANLSLDAAVLAQIDAAAERIGESRSTTVERLAEVGLPLLS